MSINQKRSFGMILATSALVTLFIPGCSSTTHPSPVSEKPLAVRLADDILARWPDPNSISNKGFEYTTGIVLRGLVEVYRQTHDPRYREYVKVWVDTFVKPDGTVDLGDDSSGHNLDRIQPGNLVLFLYEETKDPKYAAAAQWLRARFDAFPRNDLGGFWHKKKYPNEMWLDGIYMAEPFLTHYGRLFKEGGFCFDTAVTQAVMVGDKTREGGGLFRHAWDADRNAAWADPATGISPEVWARAMGWYAMALVDILENLPPDHPGYAKLSALLREVAVGLQRTQDLQTGLWYQVLDQGDRSENWLETSASAMFIYALARGVDMGVLDPAFRKVAKRGWRGLQTTISQDALGKLVVEGTVEGMSVQKDFSGYVSRKRLANAPHGLCGVLLAASAMEFPISAKPVAKVGDELEKGHPLAFPGAEGFGAYARGGRGGDVYHVTNLADSGPGSLRYGVATARGPRTIVFDLSGTIFLGSDLIIDKPFLTFAGQTAPGDGVTLAGFTTSIAGTHDVIIRFLRFRAGDINCPKFQGDSLNVDDSQNVIIDHVSVSWSIDETLSVTHSDRVTVQWSIIAQSLNNSCHKKGPHGYGSLLRYGSGGLTFHHNLYAHHNSRNPRLGDNLGLDFVNNVVFNWGEQSGYSGQAEEGSPHLNYVGNALIAGPATKERKRVAFVSGSERTEIFQTGNFFEDNPEKVDENSPKNEALIVGPYRARNERYPFPEVAADTGQVAFLRVLAHAGASLSRDGVDIAILRSVKEKTGRFIDSQKQAGGWPALRSGVPPVDSDQDGIPDEWERAHGLDPRNSADGAILDLGKISHLEDYINDRDAFTNL